MSFETILFNVENTVATVSINRPKALNALNSKVLSELFRCFIDICHQPEIRGVILKGEGGKAFVAGADIAAMQEITPLEAKKFVELGHRCMNHIETCPVPVIAAVDGFALGGGLELALACDFIYASKQSKLGLPEVNLGIFPGFGGTQRLGRVIGRNRAKELIYSAKMITADEAYQLGLVNKVCESDQLIPEVQKIMQTILKKGPVAVSLAKKVINQGIDLPLEAGLNLEANTFPVLFSTQDTKEGIKAFLEKREAKFVGK